jgi:hypothetical protein
MDLAQSLRPRARSKPRSGYCGRRRRERLSAWRPPNMSRPQQASARPHRKFVWLEVRVLPAPPRSPAQTGISRFSANRPRTDGDLCTHFVSAICRLNCWDRFGAFVSAPQNRVSRRRRLALVETRFECCVSGTESRADGREEPLNRVCLSAKADDPAIQIRSVQNSVLLLSFFS